MPQLFYCILFRELFGKQLQNPVHQDRSSVLMAVIHCSLLVQSPKDGPLMIHPPLATSVPSFVHLFLPEDGHTGIQQMYTYETPGK